MNDIVDLGEVSAAMEMPKRQTIETVIEMELPTQLDAQGQVMELVDFYQDMKRAAEMITAMPEPVYVSVLASRKTLTSFFYGRTEIITKLTGLPVKECEMIPFCQVIIATKATEEFYQALETTEKVRQKVSEAVKWERFEDIRKMIKGMVACRVCGTRYFSKQEAKACQRSHEWQNKRGRR